MTQISIEFNPASHSAPNKASGLRSYRTPPELLALFPQSPRLVELMMFRHRFGLKSPGRSEQAIIDYYAEQRRQGEEIVVLESAIVEYFDVDF